MRTAQVIGKYKRAVLSAKPPRRARVDSDMALYSFRMRKDLTLDFGLPRDMTRSEADRLASYIKTLVID